MSVKWVGAFTKPRVIGPSMHRNKSLRDEVEVAADGD